MESLTFEAGEIRRFEFSVRSQPPDNTLIITSAKWKMLDSNGEIYDEGDCVISNANISMLISLINPGRYTLEISAVIPPETIIERIYLRVVK